MSRLVAALGWIGALAVLFGLAGCEPSPERVACVRRCSQFAGTYEAYAWGGMCRCYVAIPVVAPAPTDLH